MDTQTMQIHHDKHHAGYVKKLNLALKNSNNQFAKIENLIPNINKSDTAVRNNGGGHYNHSLYWRILTPKPSEPKAEILEAINTSFGSLEKFKQIFKDTAKSRFGSGWAWLSLSKDKKLFVSSTPNQDNPLMNFVEKQGTPILGIDVWEHAYYLQYQNLRGDYINNIFNIINWEEVNNNLKLI
ncbi:superoxide dismutase [Candidatus Kapabacteria bacterium]|nr:superoxide dismutase [Candidatus Kapabacteria bacterium]